MNGIAVILFQIWKGAGVVAGGLMIIPFAVGMISSILSMLLFWHELNGQVGTAWSAMITQLAATSTDSVNALCWVSSFGVFTDFKIIWLAAVSGTVLIVTQELAFAAYQIVGGLLSAAVGSK